MNMPLGFITPSQRTWDEEKVHEDIMNSPLFSRKFNVDAPASLDDTPRVMLRDIWKHEKVVRAIGREWKGTKQFSGSCVWAGAQDVMMTINMIEVIKQKEPDKIIIPFGLFNYGLGRLRMGDRGPGEGSLGSVHAASCHEDGTLDSADAGLPDPRPGDGEEWGEGVEMEWSDGTAIQKKWKDLAKPQIIESVSQVTRVDEMRSAIRNGYAITFACNNFITPGDCRVRGSGANACNVGGLTSRGGHQTKILGTWDHPELGLLFWNNNNWGLSSYKKDPATSLGDGCWQAADDVDRAIRGMDAEIFVYSRYKGFPSAAPVLVDFFRDLYSL